MTYNDLIFRTYFENAIHSAIVVDDEFPTYDLLIERAKNAEEVVPVVEESKEQKGDEEDIEPEISWDWERSSRIYKTFAHRNIPCDIESDVSLLEENIERLRKSDLVVLDYQLEGDELPPSRALKIIQGLSLNNHFNIVIVNTKKKDLDQVWREVAVTMKNDLDSEKEKFKDIYEGDLWDELNNDDKLPDLNKEYLNAFIENDTNTLREFNKEIFQQFKGLDVPPQELKRYVTALVYDTLNNKLDKVPVNGDALEIQCKCNSEENIRWILNDKVFVVVMGKKDHKEDEDSDPEQLIFHLKRALEDWGPTPIQLLMSNIQNTVEQGSLAYRLDLIRSQKDQTAWLYQALKRMSSVGAGEAFSSFNTIISEAVKSSLLREKDINDFQNDVLTAIAEKYGPIPEEALERIEYTLKICKDDCTAEDIIRTLNFNLSCFPEIDNKHITTGTIFKKDVEYWVCSSPACDMEPTQRAKYNDWLKGLNPHRPMLALKLHKEHDSEMETATHGHVVFADNKIFGIVDKICGLPRPEMFFFENIMKSENGNNTFEAFQITMGDEELKYSKAEFTVVAQLRPEYAGRLLQKIGTHMARIGVDFEDFPIIYPSR